MSGYLVTANDYEVIHGPDPKPMEALIAKFANWLDTAKVHPRNIKMVTNALSAAELALEKFQGDLCKIDVPPGVLGTEDKTLLQKVNIGNMITKRILDEKINSGNWNGKYLPLAQQALASGVKARLGALPQPLDMESAEKVAIRKSLAKHI